MPRYFIDTNEDGRRFEDPQGVDLADDRTAIDFTWSWLREVLLDLKILGGAPEVEVSLRDAAGRRIYRIAARGEAIQ